LQEKTRGGETVIATLAWFLNNFLLNL
jgi:hypothetical protein